MTTPHDPPLVQRQARALARRKQPCNWLVASDRDLRRVLAGHIPQRLRMQAAVLLREVIDVRDVRDRGRK